MMSRMTVKTFRTDEQSEAALEFLAAQMRGSTFAQVMRTALVEAAEHRRRAGLRAEAMEAREDAQDRAAALALAEEMSELGVW